MERLTKRENGHAHYPRCFKEPCGGMGCRTEDCEFKVEICERLAAYEDSDCEPEEVLPKDRADEIALKLMRLADLESFCSYDRLRELAEADKDGRVAVLPVGTGGVMLDTSYPENPRLIKRVHFAVAYVSKGIVFHRPYNIFLENIAAGYISPVSEEAEKALEAMKNG
jgi:hypothetical protein